MKQSMCKNDLFSPSLLLLYRRAPPLISSRHKSIDFTVLGSVFINFTFKAGECLYLHVLFNLFTQAVVVYRI